jgi:hypothetical protein
MSSSRAARCVERWCTSDAAWRGSSPSRAPVGKGRRGELVSTCMQGSDAAWRGSSPSRAPVPSKRHSRVIRGHQWSSVVISGHQWSSAVISGHQWSSAVISVHQRSSVVISCHQRGSDPYGGDAKSSAVISGGRIHTVVMPRRLAMSDARVDLPEPEVPPKRRMTHLWGKGAVVSTCMQGRSPRCHQ